MAWLSYKFVILIVAAFVHSAPEGYNYNKPAVNLELPNESSQDYPQDAPLQPGQIYQKTVSYSISHEDYEYLKQQKSEDQNNVHINEPTQYQLNNQLDTTVANGKLEADANKETLVQNSEPLNSDSGFNGYIPPVLQLQPPVTTTNNYYHNTAQINNAALYTHSDVQQAINILNGASNVPDVQSNSSPVNVQIASGQNYQNNVQAFEQSQGLQPFVNVNGPQYNLPPNQVSAPVITKHIYFHVPPPDVEEIQRIPNPPQPKKTYKILFIKLPAQPSSNTIQLQSLRPVAPIEEKTLIYVLVKKPEESQVIIPTAPKLSEHEVLFIKYKDNPITDTEEVERVVEIPQRNNGVNSQILQPGFANGQW